MTTRIEHELFQEWLLTQKPTAQNGDYLLWIGFEESYFYIFDQKENYWFSDSHPAFGGMIDDYFPDYM